MCVKEVFMILVSVFLEKQQGTLRDPAHELRAKCLNVFKQAFETRKSKLVSHALCGLNVRPNLNILFIFSKQNFDNIMLEIITFNTLNMFRKS